MLLAWRPARTIARSCAGHGEGAPMRKLLRPAAALAALLATSACGGAYRVPPEAGSLPADVGIVLSLDLPALASTDIYRELQERGGQVGLNRINFYKFAQAAGIDPVRDVRWLTLLGRRHAEEGPIVDELSAIASGTFDGKKMHDFLADSGMPRDVHEGMEIFSMVVVDGRCRFCIAVLDDTTAAFGDGDTLRACAEARRSPETSLARDPSARRLLARVDGRAAIWGLTRGPRLAGPLTDFLARLGGSAPASAVGSVKDVSFFVVPGESIFAAVDALAGSDEDARLVADVLQGAGSLGRLAVKQAKPDAADLMSSFRVEVDGTLIRASASVSSARLLEMARSAAGPVLDAMQGQGR